MLLNVLGLIRCALLTSSTLLKIFEKRIKNEQHRPQIYHIRPSNSEKIGKIKCNLYWSSVCRNGFKFISMVFSIFKNPMIGWYFSYIGSKESRYFHRSHIGQSGFSNKPMLVKVEFLTSRIGLFWTKFKIRAMRMPRYNFYFGAIYFNNSNSGACSLYSVDVVQLSVVSRICRRNSNWI